MSKGNNEEEVQDFLTDGRCMCAVGRELLNSNPHRALYWFRRAQNAHYPAARFWIAWCYALGKGVEEDESKAESEIHWLIQTGTISEIKRDYIDQLAYEIISKNRSTYWGVALDLYDYTAKNGSATAADDLASYYLYSEDRDLQKAIEYAYPYRHSGAGYHLREAYLRCNRVRTNELRKAGLYDESILSEEERHPRYWLEGKTLVVKKVQYDDWFRWESGNQMNKGYFSVCSIKYSWIDDCLEMMSVEERMEYFISVEVPPKEVNPHTDISNMKDIWDMVVVDGEKRYKVIVPDPPYHGSATRLELIGNHQ